MKLNKDRLMIILGVLFFLIWLADFIFKINIVREYQYFWFCSLALLVLSIAYLFRSSTLLLALLPPVLIVQIPWTIDFFLVLFGFQPFTLGVTEMFDHGENLIDFLLSLRHLFIIPFTFLGLKLVNKKPGKSSYAIMLSIFAILILISFIIPHGNINCIRESCFNFSMNLSENTYTLLFITAFSIIMLILLFILDKFINKTYNNRKYKKILDIIIIILFVIGMCGSLLGILKLSQIPHYTCLASSPEIYCEKILTKNETSMLLSYHLNDKQGKTCMITFSSDDKIIAQRTHEVNENPEKGYLIVPVPVKDEKVYLMANCN